MYLYLLKIYLLSVNFTISIQAMLIIEAGGTKVNWLYGENDTPVCRLTSGFNPVFQPVSILEEMIVQLKNELPQETGDIYYYGTGCFNKPITSGIQDLFAKHFPHSRIEVRDDLSGSVKALLADNPGIAVILGTGTNSCKYDGIQIIEQVPSAGFILGDEGSGAHLGRLLISAWLYGELPDALTLKAEKWTGMDKLGYKKSFYSQSSPGKYAAKWAIFARENQEDDYIKSMINNNFSQFIERILLKYNPISSQKIHFTGGMAWCFKGFLETCLEQFDLRLGTVIQEPSEYLWQYHLQNKILR